MAQADALSQRPDHVLDEDHDNEDVTVLSDSIFINFINTELRESLRHPTLSGPALIKEYLRHGIIQDPKHWRVDDTDGTTLLYQERQLVFESPVRSGYFPLLALTKTVTGYNIYTFSK